MQFFYFVIVMFCSDALTEKTLYGKLISYTYMDDARVKSPNPWYIYMPVDEGLYDPPRYEEEVGQGC